LAADSVEVQQQKSEEIDIDRLTHDTEDAPVIKIVNLILVQAIKEKASDIHIEPFQKMLKLRYRIDGELIQAESPPKALQLAITSRIKILAGLNIAERRVPQDGRFRIKVMGKEVDLRISILPTSHGEKIVIRILDKSALSGSLDQMGMDEDTLGKIRKAIDAPHGMILVTGPTGSGKTTTLYSVLQELNNPQYNIVTVEDPIEYELAGINQVAVRADIGMDFSTALRSILRQDPDIVMVGEIRDNITAGHRREGGAHGSPGAEHAAHERRGGCDHATRRHGHRAVPDLELRHPDLRPASRAPHLHELPRGVHPGTGDARASRTSGSAGHNFLPRQRLRSLQRPRLSRTRRDHRSAAGERAGAAFDREARLGGSDQEPGDQ
jgi:energy-coupling factor transporter ATP-binding protein EcfA2